MHRVDTLHPAHPFAGPRMFRSLLQRQGHCVGRRHTLPKRMGVPANMAQCSSPPAQGVLLLIEE